MAGEHIVILGSGGMVATDLHLQLVKQGYRVSAFDSQTINVVDKKSIYNMLTQILPFDYVINCAAFTAVDDCEVYSKKAMAINAKGPMFIAKFCDEFGLPLIHLSTDYVFNGKSTIPYTEDSPVSPINSYGRSKLKGEDHIKNYLNEHYILRTQWVFGKHGNNFVQTIVDKTLTESELSVVADQIGSPTSTIDIANAIISIIQRRPDYGIYHFRNDNTCSWYDLAQYIVQQLNREVTVTPIETKLSGRKAKRPQNGRLDINKYLKAGLTPPRSWQDAVTDYLNRL